MRASMLTLLLCICCAALTECQRRRIEQLPRLNFQPSFNQYSGYLTSTGGKRLFYWLVESSEVSPRDAPLVLWMNGGPGCSSVGGLLMTNGPFLANDRAELDRNELAWNRLANMLYIDSPNGVGLSEPGSIDSSVLNDRFTTELNLGALLHFFSLFPEYRGRTFYIAGESYAGIYIPLLAHAILQRSSHFPDLINLKGIAVGNGLHLPLLHPNVSNARKEMCDIMGISFGGIDVLKVEEGNLSSSINYYNIAKSCHKPESINAYPCTNSTGLVTYLNDEKVRSALGIDNSVSGSYSVCSEDISDVYEQIKGDVLSNLVDLANGNMSVLLFSGTLDYLLPARVTQRLLDQLPQNATKNSDNGDGAWYYCLREAGRYSLQIGGLQKSYMRGLLRYRTVIGAGHSVPTDRPDMGFPILVDFLRHGNNSRMVDCRSSAAANSSNRSSAAHHCALLPILLSVLMTLATGYYL